MQIGDFELIEPIPELNKPHMLVSLEPWINVGSVGTLTLETLEKHFVAQDLGRLRDPGSFYDFTRYRPTMYRLEGSRRINVPNTVLRYGKGLGENDVLFLHIMEPHNRGEDLVDSVFQIAKKLDVKRYCQIGSMYGPSPHTRPLRTSGSSTEKSVQQFFKKENIHGSGYEGPTSIIAMVTEKVREINIETLSMILQLPSYAQLEENYKGQEVMLRLIMDLYGFDVELSDIAKEAERQRIELEKAIKVDPRMVAVVRQLENIYDQEHVPELAKKDEHPLSPEVENFLREIEKEDNPSEE